MRQHGGLPAAPISADQVIPFSWSPGSAMQEIANYYNSISRLYSIVGRIVDELVSMVDVMPTVLQMAGASATVSSEHYAGRGLGPLLRSEATDWREHLFTEVHFHTPHMWAPARAVTNGRWKLIHHLAAGECPGATATI